MAGGWTDERVEQLKTLWAGGMSCGQIAQRLGDDTTRNSVIGKVHRLGLPGRITTTSTRQRYRSGPASYAEKQRREAERLARKMVMQAERLRANTALPPMDIPETPEPPEFLALTFDELRRESCRYPRGEGADIRFCGQPKLAGQSYCAYCYGITHSRPHDRRAA